MASKLLNFTSLSILITLFYVTLFIYKKRMLNKKKKLLPPGPTPLPIVGSLFQISKNRPAFRWIHKLMEDFKTEIMCIRLGSVNVIVVSSPELACEFLKKNDAVCATRPHCVAAEFVSNGSLNTSLSPIGDQWKKMRGIVSSKVLSHESFHRLQDKRDQEADYLVRYVYNQCTNPDISGLINLRTVTRHHCGNLIRNIILSKRFFGLGGATGPEEEEHLSGLFTILSYVFAFSISDYLPLLRRFDLDGHQRIVKNAIDNISKYQDPIIDERIQMWKHGLRHEKEDILDVLLSLKDAQGQPILTTKEIKAQITDLILATVDNPSNAVEWAFGEMLNQPELLQRAWEELDKVVGKERLVQETDIPRLNFIKACAREAFRLHPIAPFNVPHAALSDVNVGGYLIPKGSHLLLSRVGLGRNPRVWDDPLKFKPERHIKDDGSKVVIAEPGLKLLSFSTGRRGCPGVELGSMITSMLLARLLQGFSWSLPPGVSRIDLKESTYDLFPAHPIYALARPRLPNNVYTIN